MIRYTDLNVCLLIGCLTAVNAYRRHGIETFTAFVNSARSTKANTLKSVSMVKSPQTIDSRTSRVSRQSSVMFLTPTRPSSLVLSPSTHVRVGPLYTAPDRPGGPSPPEKPWTPHPWERSLRRTITGMVESVLNLESKNKKGDHMSRDHRLRLSVEQSDLGNDGDLDRSAGQLSQSEARGFSFGYLAGRRIVSNFDVQ